MCGTLISRQRSSPLSKHATTNPYSETTCDILPLPETSVDSTGVSLEIIPIFKVASISLLAPILLPVRCLLPSTLLVTPVSSRSIQQASLAVFHWPLIPRLHPMPKCPSMLFRALVAWPLGLVPATSVLAQSNETPPTTATPVNSLRNTVASEQLSTRRTRFAPASTSSWTRAILIADYQHESLIPVMALSVATQLPLNWSQTLAAQILSQTLSASDNTALPQDSSSLVISNANSAISTLDEPAKFTAVDKFVSPITETQNVAESNLPMNDQARSQYLPDATLQVDGTSSDRVPKKRTLKSPDQDMDEYLAQENASSISPQSDHTHQGVDAERAQKPEQYGEVDGTVDTPSLTTHREFYGTTAQWERLERVRGCLKHYLDHPETTAERSPWAVMHALLAFGSDYEMIGPKGRVNAIGWMCHNGLCKTQRIFTPRGNGFVPNVGGGVQGHQGQFLAILAQCQVPPDYPIQIGDRKFTVQDLVYYEMATCRERSELTFKLIGLSYYVDSNKQWRSNDGKVWSIQKLIQEELAQPIVGAACGGTHRLMGYTFAIKQRVLQGQPLEGQYLRAAKFVNEFIDYTWKLQNPDGSFSTNWYESRGNEPKDERKVQTTGHMLEWLMFTVGDEQLQTERVEKAIDFLLKHIDNNKAHRWPIGPRGHATRALALYEKRLSEIKASDTPGSDPTAEITLAPTNQSRSSPPIANTANQRPSPTPTVATPPKSRVSNNSQRVIRRR